MPRLLRNAVQFAARREVVSVRAGLCWAAGLGAAALALLLALPQPGGAADPSAGAGGAPAPAAEVSSLDHPAAEDTADAAGAAGLQVARPAPSGPVTAD